MALYERLNPKPDFDQLFGAALAMWLDTGKDNYPGAVAETIQCPALVPGGDADLLIPTVKLAARLPGASLGVLPFGDHLVFQTHPERIAPHSQEFVASVLA